MKSLTTQGFLSHLVTMINCYLQDLAMHYNRAADIGEYRIMPGMPQVALFGTFQWNIMK